MTAAAVLCDACGRTLESVAASRVEVTRDELEVVTGLTLVHVAHEGRAVARVEGHPAEAFLDAGGSVVGRLRVEARVSVGASLSGVVRRVARLAQLQPVTPGVTPPVTPVTRDRVREAGRFMGASRGPR